MTVSSLATPYLANQEKSSRAIRAAIPPLFVVVVVVLAWAVTAQISQSAVFPGPVEALLSLWEDLQRPRFLESIGSTAKVFALAYLAAVTIGACAGMMLGLSAFWSSAVLPIIYAFNSIPKITLYPIFLLFLGIGDLGRGSFAFVSGVLPMFLIAVEATAAVNRLHLKMAASLKIGGPSLLRKIVVPSVLPALVSGMRLTFGLTFLGLLLAEMFSSSSGLGYELLRNVTLVRMGNILGEVVLIAVLALVPTLLLGHIERRVKRRFGAEV
ncbi:MAG: ABC transporter permease [Rhodococcus sp. (in: high G+C Gram-positive bacteria)]